MITALYRCAGPFCPGLPYRASDIGRPASCAEPTAGTRVEHRVERKDPKEAVGEPGRAVWEVQRITIDAHGDVIDVEEVSAHRTERAARDALSRIRK